MQQALHYLHKLLQLFRSILLGLHTVDDGLEGRADTGGCRSTIGPSLLDRGGVVDGVHASAMRAVSTTISGSSSGMKRGAQDNASAIK